MNQCLTRLFLPLLSLAGAAASLACETESSTRRSATEHAQPLTFVASAGLASMEAENYTTQAPSSTHSWSTRSESGASSGSALFAGPDNGTNLNTGYVQSSPRLNFEVQFDQVGTYYVWVRGRDSGAAPGSSDSLHVGLDGQAVASADRISSFSTSMGWSKSTMDGPDATLQVSSPGAHTVNVWMREDGFIFDKLVLSTSANFTPTGTGPAETLSNEVECGDGTCESSETCSECALDCGACPSCDDGVQNGDETGQDCGGPCPACPTSGVTAVWLEAEDAVRTGNPGFTLQSNATAAGGQYLASPSGNSYDVAGSARATFTFDVAAGNYVLWARVTTPNADDDSFWVSVDGAPFIKWNSIPATSTWAWDDLHDSDAGSAVVSFTLGAGPHTLVVANREDGALLDKIYLTANGDVPSGLGEATGTCSDGVQNQGETAVDCGGPCPTCPVCSDGDTRLGMSSCGVNGRGSLEQLCSGGQWVDSSSCIDPDVCADGAMQPGMTSCGLNSRGSLDEECVLGMWQDSAICQDPDSCIDDDVQPGSTPCGDGGAWEQICVTGQWEDSDICTLCVDGQTQPGTTACGLNGRGALLQSCAGGQWSDSSVCVDPDVCVDGQTQVGGTACGLNGRGTLEQLCSLGQWLDSSDCVDPDVCVDGQTQPGIASCGLNGRGLLEEQCTGGAWQDSSLCVDPDVCVDDTVRPGSTACGNGGTLEEVCQSGSWMDSATCVETGLNTFAWLEAEDASLSGSPGFSVGNDAAAANGQYLSSPTGNSYDTPGAARATFTFEVEAGTYALWARLITPNGDDDSFWISVDGGAFVKWNSIAASSTWAWARVHDRDNGAAYTSYALSAGTHTVVVTNREDGALIDKLYLTANGDVPTGTGGQTGTCSDGVLNQGEVQIDCGGPCPACPSCDDGTCDPDEDCSSCSEDCGACPVWANQDIGSVAAPGSMSLSGGTFTIMGSGDDIHSLYGDPLDEFHFVYQPVTGDATIVARVVSVENTNEWAKGGVMFRETLATDSKFALVFARPDGGVQAQFRSQTAQTGTDSGDAVGNAATKWVMLERSGDEFSTYYSTNGVDFTLVGTETTIAMASTVYVGLAVTSHNDGTLCTAEFDQVSVMPAVACGDGMCDPSEDCSSCQQDCGGCGPCGDGVCDAGESCTSCSTDCGQCPATGLDQRPSNTSCLAPPALSSTVAVQNVWSNITFTQPMQVLQPPGDNSRLIVVQRQGAARSAPLSATSGSQVSTFVQLNNVDTSSNGGFLSMAFHPDWETNRYAYVVYTTSNRMKRLSRFQSTNGGQSLNTGTELVIFQQQHDHEFNHNGGQIDFGKDGYLYMSTGDDAYLDYQRARHCADPNSLFGKMLRFDVDAGSPYAIPQDNPFVNGGGHPLVFAYGLRNPWRFSVDRLTGEVWLGDVGEDNWEEVNIIRSGQFYGWPYYEGDSCFTGQPADCATPYASPKYSYTSGAASISGGFVYRGATMPSLYGKYVFGDYVSGQVSVYDPTTGNAQAIPGTNNGAIVGLGEDNAGELYVVRIASGRIEKLVPDSGGGPTDFPQLLTDTGCFDLTDPTQVVSGVIPYTVAQPFWSDGVAKERYLALPNGTTMTVSSDGDWELPPGAVTIKNFRHQGQLFETRFFVRHQNGTYSGYTYQWNAQQNQATLVPASGASRSLPELEWSYPSRGECFACHTDAANYSLGLETRQLNVDGFYPSTGRTANQLLTLDVIGMLVGNTAALAPYPEIDDTSVSIQQRAEAYLHINCSNCHRPGGPGGGPMDVRYTTSWVNKNMCNEPATLGSLGLSDPVLVAPGDHMGSIAWLRMSERDTAYAMPPLSSTVVDAAGAALLQQWIDTLTSCP